MKWGSIGAGHSLAGERAPRPKNRAGGTFAGFFGHIYFLAFFATMLKSALSVPPFGTSNST